MKKALYVFSFLVILCIAYLLLIPSLGSARPLPLSAAEQLLLNPAITSNTNVTSLPPSLWMSPAVPQALRENAERWGMPIVDDPASASLHLDTGRAGAAGATWIYVLVAPFPTVADGVTFDELLANWRGTASGPFAGRPLFMDDSTMAAFTTLWAPPDPEFVQSVPADQLLDAAWSQKPSWAIVPFESLDPRWKVLTVNDQSPIQKGFQVARYYLMGTSFDYPLAVTFTLSCSSPCPISALPALPSTNRDPSKMTTLMMSGVTALVRATAYTMNSKGITYPGRDIRDWFVQADLTHVNNEVPFFDGCPNPDPSQSNLVFCSDPRYIQLLNYIGTDVVELTGNHFADYGPAAMDQTLALYKENRIAYYGGGANLEEARKPLLLENNGNKVAFIGCNSVDVGRLPTASLHRSGAAPCDYDYLTQEIRQLRNQGYLVVATFQYYETYAPKPFDGQIHDFRLLADAGANIIQGSQAHYAQTMEFYHHAFIHYGLGNLFFDQMGNSPGSPIRREFIDRHVFYDGRYISTELLTTLLEDYSQPQPMTPQERAAFLAEYFAAGGW